MTRVLVVLPFYGGSLPVGRYCAEALKDTGCLVDVFEAPDFYGSFQAFKGLKVKAERLEYMEHAYLNLMGEAVLAQVERFQPDLVLSMAQAPLSRKTLQRLKKDGVTTAMWFVEDSRLFMYWRAFAPLYDVFAVIQKEPFLSELKAIGVNNALYLPLAALPAAHRPMELSPVEQRRFGSDISFMGAGYPNRRMAFRSLTGLDFKIWGTEWEGDAMLAPLVQEDGARISSDDAVRIFNASKINLNLHSGVRPDEPVTHGDFVNPRTFEIGACGAFQIVDKRSLLPELFKDDELATFETLDEMRGLIDHYLTRQHDRAALAQKAQERVLADHTYQKRMQTLLNYVADKCAPWPRARRQSPWPEGLAQEDKEALDALVKEHNLPPDADFDSVIAAIRAQNGRLSHLESALLFLDEWNKQYFKK